MRAESRSVLAEGAMAGLIGYATIVAFFVLVNLVAGRSIFYTAALFGSALFYDLRDPMMLEVTTGPVVTYNVVHLLVFLALGLVAAWLVSKLEQFPVLWLPVLLAAISVAAFVVIVVFLFAAPLLGAVAWWQLGLSSILAAVLMAWYLFQRHPLLRQELREIARSDVEA